jgi:dihydrofolate reductase
VHSVTDALALAHGDDEVFIAGGGEIYRVALPLADRLYLTIVHTEATGDTVFPDFAEDEWELQDDIRHDPDEKHEHAYSFRLYTRKRQQPASR